MSDWTIGSALAEGKKRLQGASSSASLDAQLLLAHVLGIERSTVLAYPERPLTDDQLNAYASLIQRRAQGEPYAYIVGHREFYGREFIVSPAVLIPRPETELIIENALNLVADFYRDPSEVHAVDVGTGSGAIIVAFGDHFPDATLHAVDISQEALEIAKKNAERFQVKVNFMHGNMLEPLIERNIKVNLVLANLPYIPTAEAKKLDVSKYEPFIALDGGLDGLDYFDELFHQVAKVGIPPIRMFLEVGAGQSDAVIELAKTHLEVMLYEVIYDYAGHDRVVRLSVK